MPYILIGIFLSPLIFLLVQFKIPDQLNLPEIWWALKNTIYQSFFSALIVVIFGFFIGQSLFSLKSKVSHKVFSIIRSIIVLPSFVPSIFVVLFGLKFIDPYPMGIIGIVIMHFITYVGFCGVLFCQDFERSISDYIELATIDGLSKSTFFAKILVPLMKPSLIQNFVLIFILCFSSFSIPLLVGGGRGTTIEVLIYEKIKISGDFSAALLLSCLQMFILILMSISVLNSKQSVQIKNNALVGDLLLMGSFFVTPMLITVGFIVSQFIGFVDGLQQMSEMGDSFFAAFTSSLIETAKVTLTCLSVFLFMVLTTLYLYKNKYLQFFIKNFIAPTQTLIALFLLMYIIQYTSVYVGYAVAMVLSIFALQFRTYLVPKLNTIKNQLQQAEILGLDSVQIFLRIMLPQLIRPIGIFMSTSLIWCIGDFTMSRLIIGGSKTLTLLMDSLISSYRLNPATVVSALLLIIFIFIFIIFEWMSYVFDKKYN